MKRRLLTGLALLVLSACGSSGYCQTGPKYGTQCYSPNDAQAPGERPAPADASEVRQR